MSNSRERNGMTAEDLKKQLFESMRSSGILRELKGKLRHSMINDLRGNRGQKPLLRGHDQPSDLLAATIKHRNNKTWVQQVLDNLIFHHLKQSRYQYSLSLFQEEANVSIYMPNLTNQLLVRLGLQSSDVEVNDETPDSSASEDLPQCTSTPNRTKEASLILWKILESLSVSKAQEAYSEKENQSEEPKEKPVTKSLGEKFREIDEEMKLSSITQPRNTASTITSYTAAVRRAEDYADKRYRASFEQWKALELSKLKVEQSKKMKDEIDARCKELEREYQQKRDGLSNRERAAVDRMNNQRQLLEREMHDQRQNLLRELEQLGMREDTLSQQESLIREMEAAKLKELNILKEQTQQQSTQEASLSDPLAQPHYQEQVHQMQREIELKSIEAEEFKNEITDLKAELAHVRAQKAKGRESENLVLEKRLDSLVSEIRELKSERKAKKPEDRSGIEKWCNEVEELKTARAEQDMQRLQLEETLKQMRAALNDSNKAMTLLVSQPLTGTLNLTSNMPKQMDPLREYEPVQTDLLRLHPALTASDHLNDPSLNSSIASAGVRPDLRHRLKELEAETSEIDEEYQRYLRTNYRELLTTQSHTRTGKHVASGGTPGSPAKLARNFNPVASVYRDTTVRISNPPSPSGKTAQLRTRSPSHENQPQSNRDFSVPSSIISKEAAEKPLENSKSLLEDNRQATYSSLLDPSHIEPRASLPAHPVAPEVTKQALFSHPSGPTQYNLPQAVTYNEPAKEKMEEKSIHSSEDVSLKIPVETLKHDSEEYFSSPGSKSSSEDVSSPIVDTVRKAPLKQVIEDVEGQESLASSLQKLPPLTQLPPIQKVSNSFPSSFLQPEQLSLGQESRKEPNLVPAIVDNMEEEIDLLRSDISNTEPLVGSRSDVISPGFERSESKEEESKPIVRGESPVKIASPLLFSAKDDDIRSRSLDSKSLDESILKQRTDLSAVHSKQGDVVDNFQDETSNDGREFQAKELGSSKEVDDLHDLLGDVSSVSEVLESISQEVSSDAEKELFTPLAVQTKEEEDANLSPDQQRKSPRNDSEKVASYSSHFTSDESVSIDLPKKSQTKKVADYDFSDEDDISAVLRWGEENQPTLESDNEEVAKLQLSEKIRDEVNPPDSYKEDGEIIDVFETSDPQLSLDSTASEKAELKKDSSDDESW